MCALYTFLRVADDISDEPGDIAEKRRRIDDYREGLNRSLAGNMTHPFLFAFADTVRRHGIPVEYLYAALDGVSMDLDVSEYETFDDLYRYCYRVASVVGLSCIHIWGFRDGRAKEYAEAAGIAFQMTNILRDLGEDASLGRVYLPRRDMEQFGYTSEQLSRRERGPAFESLMSFEAARAQEYYEKGSRLVPLLQPAGRAVFLVMLRTYRRLLGRIVASRFDVFGRRIRVSKAYKLWQVLRALPVRFGLL
jgi:phytoene synthase